MTNTSAERLEAWPLGGYAPGDYENQCAKCGGKFIGDKCAYECLECASAWAKDAMSLASRSRQDAEPVAYLWKNVLRDPGTFPREWRQEPHKHDLTPLYAHPPQPQPQQATAGSEVVTLAWKQHTKGVCRAETIVGDYRVWTHHEAPDGLCFWSLTNGPNVGGGEGTEQECLDACQADFTSRIQSCLVTPSAVDGDVGEQGAVWKQERPNLRVATVQHDDYSMVEIVKVDGRSDLTLVVHTSSEERSGWDDMSITLTPREAAQVAAALSSPSEPSEEEVERAAEQNFKNYNHRLKGSYGMGWSDIGGHVKEAWRKEARETLQAALNSRKGGA